jgi:hypothetical protein
VKLADLDIPAPADAHGGVLEVHVVRTDRTPRKQIEALGMWVHAEGPDGGGYLIPTIPIRGQRKDMVRDDLQVLPGVMSSRETETEIVLVNPIDRPTRARITVSSADGLLPTATGSRSAPGRRGAGPLSNELPRAAASRPERRHRQRGGVLVAQAAAVYGFRRDRLAARRDVDHGAPIFA